MENSEDGIGATQPQSNANQSESPQANSNQQQQDDSNQSQQYQQPLQQPYATNPSQQQYQPLQQQYAQPYMDEQGNPVASPQAQNSPATTITIKRNTLVIASVVALIVALVIGICVGSWLRGTSGSAVVEDSTTIADLNNQIEDLTTLNDQLEAENDALKEQVNGDSDTPNADEGTTGLTIISSEMKSDDFLGTNEIAYVVKNDTDTDVDDIMLDVRYLDANGNVVDVRTGSVGASVESGKTGIIEVWAPSSDDSSTAVLAQVDEGYVVVGDYSYSYEVEDEGLEL